MPLHNRVKPTGDIVATNARGTFMGNRGIIHDPDSRTLLNRRWMHQAWVCCQLEFKGRQREVMGPGTYTELFFLDEATALAAGHRPCGACRRGAFNAFMRLWFEGNSIGRDARDSIKQIDRQMHRDRVNRQRRQRRFDVAWECLPSGTMILVDTRPHLVLDRSLRPWGENGYATPLARYRATVTVLTPRSTVLALRAGYRPNVHPSAG